MMQFDHATASNLASLVLAHVRQEYPNKLDHVLTGPRDLAPPSVLHPVFYGSFDWHSNVHGYWLLATLYRRVPSLPERARIRSLFDDQLTADKVAGELAYLNQPLRGTFERPYGWAWLLLLGAELARAKSAEGRGWHTAIAPLARAFADHFRAFLPKARYPIRVGTHFNTAFALSLALEYADACDDADLGALVRAKVRAWYGEDRDCQAWEPGGDDFLSPALMEAECMRRVLEPEEWSRWMDEFLPRLASGQPRTLFAPADVSDRSDGKIAHLDGLNLSRAWCWRSIAQGWGEQDPRRAAAIKSADDHVQTSLPHLADDYAGAHWLATYALLALLADGTVRDS
jgi:hypothetical protein